MENRNGKTFLQSDEWLDFQRFLGRKVFTHAKDGLSANIIRRDIQLGKNYLVIGHGPLADFNQMTGGINNVFKNFVQELRHLAKKEKSIFVHAEPLYDSVAQELVRAGFKKAKHELQPHKTVINDLVKSEEEILAGAAHGTRYSLRVAQRNNVRVAETDDIEIFIKLLKKTAQRQKFGVHPKEYYQKFFEYFRPQAPRLPAGRDQPRAGLQARLFVAYHNDEPLAAALILIWQDTAYYLHGASDYEQKNLRAPNLLHWDIMRHLKSEGVKHYDWWGVDSKKWPGVTEFKLGWGGQVVERPGSFDLTISWFWSLMYRLVKTNW